MSASLLDPVFNAWNFRTADGFVSLGGERELGA